MIDDISGAGYTVLAAADLSGLGWGATDLRPYDVGLDSMGRIYIANNYGFGGAAQNCIVRVNDMSGSGALTFPVPEVNNGIEALALDRVRGHVYYAGTNPAGNLYRAGLDGAGQVLLTTNAIDAIRGLAVHTDGTVYIAGDDTGADRIFRYNPDSRSKIGEYGAGMLNTPWFYNPRRFVAILNHKIIIVDDRQFENWDKVVSIDDITGAGWTTLPSSGDGQSLYKFFYFC